jgi:hypothetical protein
MILTRFRRMRETLPLWRSYYRIKLKRVLRAHSRGLTVALTVIVVGLALSGLALLGSMSSGLPTGYAVVESSSMQDCNLSWFVLDNPVRIAARCKWQSINSTGRSLR